MKRRAPDPTGSRAMRDEQVVDAQPAHSGEVGERACAKINLALHVTGRRADGYHTLETVVVFADVADIVTMTPAERDSVFVTGPFAADLDLQGNRANIIETAREMLRRCAGQAGRQAPPVAIRLEKCLPVAAGLGGGSADAAAVIRGLTRLWSLDPAGRKQAALAAELGADVPMCLVSKPLLARGNGDEIDALPSFPGFPVVLVNPREPLATASVFKTLRCVANPGLDWPGSPVAANGTLATLATMRNDLQAPAETLVPAIGTVLAALARTRPALARMSGSGATCFALYHSDADAAAAASALRRDDPGWYVAAGHTLATP